MNTFGTRFRLTSFGESHGAAIGGVIDGIPAGVEIDMDFIADEMSKRKPGGKYATNRKEDDKVEILSGVFEENGILLSTGTSIGFIIANTAQHSKDYENLKDIFRPGHGDFSYFAKYGIREHRGGGRTSARETAVRVAGGAFAGLVLKHFGISVSSGVFSVGDICFEGDFAELLAKSDFNNAKNSEIFALIPELEVKQKELIKAYKDSGESIGASVLSVAKGVFAGLGEPIYNKLDSRLADALMSINGVKAVEIGAGASASKLKGSQNNDGILPSSKPSSFGAFSADFSSNNAGGVLAGISNGADIVTITHFKPTPSIFSTQRTINKLGIPTDFSLAGRHDPCIGVRGSVVATAMLRLVLADMLLLGASSRIDMLKRAYSWE